MTEFNTKVEYFQFDNNGVTIDVEVLVTEIDDTYTEEVQYTHPPVENMTPELEESILRCYHIYKETQEIIDDF